MEPSSQGGQPAAPDYNQVPVESPQRKPRKPLIIGSIVAVTLIIVVVVVLLVGRSSSNQSINAVDVPESVDGTLESAQSPAALIAASREIIENAESLATDRNLIQIDIDQEADEETNATLVEEFEDAIENGELAPDDIPPLRYSGENRFATMAAVSKAAFPDASNIKNVVIVNGGSDIDMALAATYADGETTILLVEKDSVPTDTTKEIRRIIASEARGIKLTAVGGEAAISREVFNTVRDQLPVTVSSRRGGNSRYETAAAISRDRYPRGDVVIAYIASADSYADIMLAANGTVSPVLLVDQTSAPEVTSAELCRLGAEHVIVVGGAAAVDTQALEGIDAHYKRAVDEGGCSDDTPNFYKYKNLLSLSGDSRLETSIAVSQRNFAQHAGSAIIVNGYAAPDILAAVVLSQSQSGNLSILYVNQDNYSDSTVQELKRLAALQLFVIGGERAVSERIMHNMRCAQFGGCEGYKAGPTQFGN